jgi:hypothetical protein
MPNTTCTPRPPAMSRRRHVVLAAEARPAHRTTPTITVAERRSAYRVSPPAAATDSAGVAEPAPDVAAEGAPFGLPVLAELPMLAGMLERLTVADQAMSDALRLLARLLADDEVATVTGVGVEEWIGIVARHTRMDRRLLLRIARLLDRFPTLHRAVVDQQLSWPQLRGLSLALRDVPTVLDARLDEYLNELLPHLEDTDPDAVIDQVRRAIAEWTADLAPDDDVDTGPGRNHLYLQPRLDGTGGRITGEFDAVGLAILDDALAPRRNQLDHPGGAGGARADNLLTRLTHTCPPSTDPRRAGADVAVDEDTGDGTADDTGGAAGGVLPPVKLLLRCELDALLGATRTPAALLTRLVGGSLRLSSTAARRLLEVHGAELRTVIVDDGQVLGVGRTTRIPPGWLRDATLAVHDTCTGPLCDRPARTADLDHATPWWPTHPHDPPGGTDLANLGPLCATTNRTKETAGWRAHQHPDGRRTWTHPRTGLTITTIPATWRPPPGGTDPP